MIPQPDWALTPEFNIINHKRLSRELLSKHVPTINLCWERNVKGEATTRDLCVQQVQQALDEACLTPMVSPAEDIDLVSAVYVLQLSTGSLPVVLPEPTSVTASNINKAGFTSIHSVVSGVSFSDRHAV